MSIAIVGATGSVGRSLSHLCRQAGYTPWLISRYTAPLTALSSSLDNAPFTTLDVMDADEAKEILKPDMPKDLVGYCYAVGSIDLKPFSRVMPEDLRSTFDLNVTGMLSTLQPLLPTLKKNSGSVVLFSSVAVGQGFSNHTSISASKGAIEGITRTLAAELSPKVRVNCVAPSLFTSALSEGMLSNDAVKKGIEKSHPMGRVGEGEDVARAAMWLLGKEQGWVTGQIVGVDGGRSTVA